MSYKHIEINKIKHITEITLNTPKRRNPLSIETIAELTAAFHTIADSDALGVILSARGPVFCAGHDYRDMVGKELAHLRKLMGACSNLMQLIHSLPQTVVARVQGPAIGAGCQLALSCDFVVASEVAFFQTTGGKSGWFCFTPMVTVTRAVGRKRALEMLMVGDPISARQASEWGMINRVVPADALDEETFDLISRATRGSPQLMGMGKHAFYAQLDLNEADAYTYATELMASSGTLPDPQERMLAFVEKRKPNWKR